MRARVNSALRYAGRGDRARVQLRGPDDPRALRVADPHGGGQGRGRAAGPHPVLVRALDGLRGAQGGGARGASRGADHGPRLDPLPASGDGIRAPRRHQQPALQVRPGPARGAEGHGVRHQGRAGPAAARRAAGDDVHARDGGPLLRLSDEAARVPGPLPELLPARRDQPRGDDRPDRQPDAQAAADARSATTRTSAPGIRPGSASPPPRFLGGPPKGVRALQMRSRNPRKLPGQLPTT